MSFFYSFIGMLLHSIWQAALLTLTYMCISAFAKKMHPISRRNLIYSILSVQIIVSIATFIYIFSEKKFGSINSIFHSNSFSFSWLNEYASTICFLYFVVVLYKFLSVIFQWNLFIKNYRNDLLKPSAELKIYTELKAQQLGIVRKVKVWYCKNIESPITFGFLKPMILLPFSLINALSMEEVETIILHELAHIKSKDYLLNWLLMGMEITYFFNPFVKILTNKIKLEREKNCDTQVLDFNYNEILYAQTLLKIAQNSLSVKPFQLGAVKQTSQLLQRIQFFSVEENRVFKQYRLNIFGWLLIPFLLFITTFLIQKKQIGIDSMESYGKVIFAPIYKEEKLNKNLELEKVIIVDAPKKIENKPESLPEIVEQEAQSKSFTFDESAIIMEDVLPVRYDETADSVKEFLYNIETQNGKMTQSYKLIKRSNRWVLEPQWMIVERNNDTTLLKLKADSIFNSIDSIQ